MHLLTDLEWIFIQVAMQVINLQNNVTFMTQALHKNYIKWLRVYRESTEPDWGGMMLKFEAERKLETVIYFAQIFLQISFPNGTYDFWWLSGELVYVFRLSMC